MSTRKNPIRAAAGNKASASHPQPTTLQFHPSTDFVGDTLDTSPTTRLRRRRGSPSDLRQMYQQQNGGSYGQSIGPLFTMDSPEPQEMHILVEGEDPEPIFKTLLDQNRLPARSQYPPPRNHRESMANEGGTPIPVPPRPPLWEAGVSYLNDAGLDSPYSVNTEPTQRTPPDYNYQLTPPNNLIYLTSPINPMDLPADARNPTGSNYIVQTTKHAYELMKLEAEARSHHGMRPPPPGAVIPLYTTSEGYPVYSDPRTQPHIRQQEHSWQQQQQRAGNPSETWPVQQSPTSIPQGWQQPNQDSSVPHQQQPPLASPAGGPYRPQPGWNPAQAQTHPERATPPSPSPAFWRPGAGQQQQQPQQQPTAPQSTPAAPQATVRTREGPWAQGDPNRPPSRSAAPLTRWSGPGPSPVTTNNPASWGPSPAGWQGPGGPQRTAGPLQHQPHPDIDGPSDNNLRWSAGNNSPERNWQGRPTESNAAAPENAGNGGAPGTTMRYSVDESGRPIQVRMSGIGRTRMGSDQAAMMATQGNTRPPPWAPAQPTNNPGVPLDSRLQTPGGTGATMGGHHAAAAVPRPPTAGSGPYGQPGQPGPPGYPAYATRPGSVHGQPRPGEFGPAPPGSENPYGSQPDSMATYRQNNAPGGAPAPSGAGSAGGSGAPGGMQPPPPSAGPGASQGYPMTGTSVPVGNPYPPVPPASGAPPYGVSRPGMISQQQQQQAQQQAQQHHQQPQPNAHGNMYPNVYTVTQGPGQGQSIPGAVYAPYSSAPVSYPMPPGAPMARQMTRMVPAPGGIQMNAYGHHPPPLQEMYGRMGPGPAGAGGVEGYRPPQPQH